MEVIVYRNIEGLVTSAQLKQWSLGVQHLGPAVEVHPATARSTICRVQQGNQAISFLLFGSGSEGARRLRLPYVRLAPGNPLLAASMDALIALAALNGEKHTVQAGVRSSAYYAQGKEARLEDRQAEARFDLLLRKETVQGGIHRALSQYSAARKRQDTPLIEQWELALRGFVEELAALEARIRIFSDPQTRK